MCTLSLMSGGGGGLFWLKTFAKLLHLLNFATVLVLPQCTIAINLGYEIPATAGVAQFLCVTAALVIALKSRYLDKLDQRTVAYTESSEEPCRRAGQLIIVRFAMSGDMLKG